MSEPHYLCPRCGAVSYNPTDIAEGYCGRCHDFTGKTNTPNYHCPLCEHLSTLILSDIQAFCTNTDGCKCISFNPSLPDRGMSSMNVVDLDLQSPEPEK